MSSEPADVEARRPEPWLSTALRVLVHAITGAVIAWPLTIEEGVIAAALGAASGSFAARYVAKSPLRLPAIAALAVAALFGVLVLRWLVVDLAFVPEQLGPAGALLAGEAVVFGLGGFVVACGLRAASARHRSVTILEAALVAGGFATLLVAHRNGAIHRPYELSDPILSAGEDPTIAILGIGIIGAGVVGLLLLSERSIWRSVFHLAVVAALLALIFGTTTMSELPTPPSTGGALGLQDDESQAESGSGGGGGGAGGRRNSDELDFLDQYPSGGGAPDAVAIFHDDYSPPGGYYYFRQNAFSQFNGHKLVGSTRRGIDEDVRNHFPTNRAREVAWDPGAGMDRTSVETTIALLADNSAPIGLEAPTRFVPATNPNPQRFQRIYRTESVALTTEPFGLVGRPAGDPAWDEETRSHYLELPADPRYRALAQRIVGELPEHLREEPIARALAITGYLGREGTYSLRSRHSGFDDPTAHFLFGDLTGYCVHFAHAAVFLMRAVGLPARVGTGYALPEANRQGGSALLLRNSDQHAWPEVYLGPAPPLPAPEGAAIEMFRSLRAEGMLDLMTGTEATLAVAGAEETALAIDPDVALPPWEPEELDPTDRPAVELRVEAIAAAVGRSVDALLDDARAHFAPGPAEGPGAGWVVTDVAPESVLDGQGEPPDPQLQRLLGEMARGSQPIDDAPIAPRPMRELIRTMTRPFGLGVASLLAAILALGYAIKLWRALAPRFASATARPRVLYRATLDRLSEDGLRRRWGESPEAFARREAARLPSLAAVTAAHLAAAFGGRVDDARLARMAEDARSLRGQLGRAVPLWRRALGWINPFSWMLSR